LGPVDNVPVWPVLTCSILWDQPASPPISGGVPVGMNPCGTFLPHPPTIRVHTTYGLIFDRRQNQSHQQLEQSCAGRRLLNKLHERAQKNRKVNGALPLAWRNSSWTPRVHIRVQPVCSQRRGVMPFTPFRGFHFPNQ